MRTQSGGDEGKEEETPHNQARPVGAVTGGDKLCALEDAETPDPELDAEQLEERLLAERIEKL